MIKTLITTLLLTINNFQSEPITHNYIIEYGSSKEKSIVMEIETNNPITELNDLILNSVFVEEDFTNGIFDNHQKTQTILVNTPKGEFELYLPNIQSITEITD